MSHQDAALRQALAVAIVRNKRRWIQETNEMREKTRHLETELAKQQHQQEQLKQWVATVWQQDSTTQDDPACQNELFKVQHSGIFLPPLELKTWQDDQLDQSDAGSFQSLRQQVVLAAAASAGDSYSALAQVVDGKAATLSRMLLTNIQMLQRLSATQPGHPSAADINRSGCIPGPLAQGHASEIVSSISSFITSTLLIAPRSSLSTEYMKQSAAALAAVLAPPGSSSLTATSPAAEQCPGQCQQQEQAECDTAEALASQVVQLTQQLLAQRSAACLDLTGTSTGSSQTSAAATIMLQQLSTFPSTALLLCVAVAQGLQQHVQLLKDSSAVVMSIKPANLGTATAAGEQAMLAASQAFEASYELLTDLEHAVLQIPAWGALSSSTWTPRALEDLVGSAASMYHSCTGLQTEQPLLAGRMCSLCSSLATALQQLAADGDAPGMNVGLGIELRSVTAGLCMQLRDLFMPSAC